MSRIPAVAHHPGVFARNELSARGLKYSNLPGMTGLSAEWCERFLKERAPVTDDSAKALAAAFGTSPELWTNIQASWRVWKWHRIDGQSRKVITELEQLIRDTLSFNDQPRNADETPLDVEWERVTLAKVKAVHAEFLRQNPEPEASA